MTENSAPPPAVVALLDQLRAQLAADTLAMIRIGRDGTADVKRFHMSRSALAAALREIADGLDVLATRERGGDQ